MSNHSHRVRELIRDIRARWRRRAILQGAALSIGVPAALGSVLLLLYRFTPISPPVLVAGAAVGAALFLALTYRFVLRPALKKISDRQIALYIEEQIPDLEDRLNSAVEIADPGAARRAHGILVDRLIDDAAERARLVPLATVVDQHRERMLTAAGTAGLVLFLILIYSSLGDLRISFGGASLAALIPSSQPHMTIEPGNVEIEQGASQEVVVTLREETEREVVVHYRSGDGPWQKEPMQAAVSEPAFLFDFLHVQEPVEYFVEHDQLRSDVFRISLYTFPAVVQIDQTHTYPAYTGLERRRQENTGDIRGLKGSVVTLDVLTSGTVQVAELVLEGDRVVDLEEAGDGRFRGSIRLDEPGFYSVRLTDAEQKQNKFPDEYRITPVDDEKPYVTVTEPQRDVRANAVQEVLVAARAEDDFGLKAVRLRFAVNGGEEQTIPLQGGADPTEVVGEHVFFLEDFNLSPGDVVSYYVEAEDLFHDTPAATDMYFVEIIPFDQNYSQANAGGMPGAGQQSGIVLSQQQIIAATWKLFREGEEMGEPDYTSSRQALVQAQENLRRNIEQRINATAFSLELDAETREIAEHLRAAVKSMGAAVEDLEDDRLRDAMTPEREALNHLLRADAQNRERQIALNRGQPGSGNASATEERMTELMDLELDIAKDKYETLPEASSSQGGSEMDEALQKLRELARRQENLANESGRALEGEDERRMVERLKRDQDDLRRQAESLSQSMRRMARGDARLGEDAEEQLDRVAQNMRQAEQALSEGDMQRARARQQQAVNGLERLSQDLRSAGSDDRREALDGMDREFDQMLEQERQLARELEEAAGRSRSGPVDRADLEDLVERRQDIRDGLARLERQAEALAGGGANEPELATAARNLRQTIQRQNLDEQMEDSEQALKRGWLDHAVRREESLQESLRDVEDAMRAFEDQLPVTDEERLARSLDELRELERDLRVLQEQMAGQGSGEQDRSAAASRQARMARARERLDRLQQDLGGTPAAQGLEQLRRSLTRADHAGVSLEGEAAEAFFSDDVFAPLSQLEKAVMTELDQVVMEKKLYGSRPGDVPDEYRDLVERYYEALSKSAGR